MDDCIFCQIVAGSSPCHKVYEDADFLGFLDLRPLNPGNSLLIPKKHYIYTYNVPNFGEYWEAAKKLALSIQKAVSADSMMFLTIGEEVPHAHIRIIPRFKNDGGVLQLIGWKNISEGDMKEIAEKILP